ncbi:MAG: 30S ribosomal protein S16 [Sweet potato little leaf phytoplasma]|uniref:Small ribosomal subunit protein bS16 n=4 Tax=Candidatus Phytoplasma TaxID=33926 RepID=A0A9K3WSJ4_9MOLU|nr:MULTISPECIES: 30S ribosomal protein S16 [Phytoplasma]WEX20197.1 MAG: 30S ribosomal protein S16 [Candidatus Phytoplasma aurantifolia]EMR14654.1 30S ribosomal protein S16 [Peanut witches'-broom phytoplasma NTU2011]MCG3566649.1 30S ribosomal protein S16 [Sesame phyllody phytoplasma]MDO7986970.1 30S ribosomal protein S16 [Sweet potato little leaf phytoplasma]MDO8005352.1 30S ribosomal protein S16 [Sweet potato little leaf phytoplasma]
MSVKIRLQLFGSRHKPFYRVVAIDAHNKRNGKFLEILGNYDPLKGVINLNLDKINYWLSLGGQPTTTVKNLCKKFKKTQIS